MTEKKAIVEQLDKIEQLARMPGNEWLLDELKKRFSDKKALALNDASVAEDISFIRSALNIRAYPSIDYGFIGNQRLREQLLIDNLRMENAALDLKEKENSRFYTFCVNAFYQVENIINYYFYVSYPQIKDLLNTIEEATKDDGEDGKFQFKRSFKNPESNVAAIPMFYKINALCNLLLTNDTGTKITLGNLRLVRNEGEHRCQILYTEKDESNKLYQFLEKATFNSIRITLIKVVTAIKEQIRKQNEIANRIIETTGNITNKLPSTCFVSCQGGKMHLPDELFPKVRNLQEGAAVKIKIKNNKIIDVSLSE